MSPHLVGQHGDSVLRGGVPILSFCANCRSSMPTLSCCPLVPPTVLQLLLCAPNAALWIPLQQPAVVLPIGLGLPGTPANTRRRPPWLKCTRTPTPGPGGGRSAEWRPGRPERGRRARWALTA